MFDDRHHGCRRLRVLYLAPIAWNSLWQRPQQLALRLSRQFDLTYVQPVGMRRVRLSDVQRFWRRRRGQQHAGSPPAQLRLQYVPFPGVALFDELNRRWLIRQLRGYLDECSDSPWILWIGAPNLLAAALVEECDPHLVVYDCMDRYAAFHAGRARTHIERTEQVVIERADVIFTTSVTLYRSFCKRNAHVVLAPNGIDFAPFCHRQSNDCPAWLAELRRPVIGFHGTLGSWLDYELLARLLEKHPQWSFAFVGPIHTSAAANLMKRNNAFYQPEVPYSELPRHSAHFDVATIPFKLNELTQSVHPIKALEYLALGLPVVSRPLPDLLSYEPLIQFAHDEAEWSEKLTIASLSQARAADVAQSRRDAVESQSWDDRYRCIREQLDSALRRKQADRTLSSGRPARLDERLTRAA